VSTTFEYIYASNGNKKSKINHEVVYSSKLSGSVRRTFAYIHASEMETSNLKQTKKWFTLVT